MEQWRTGIEMFDCDLRRRMMVISQYEVTGVDIESGRFFRFLLGFPVRGVFPGWRDHTKEWRNRNRDRVNFKARIQSRLWRLKNLEKARERERGYYHRDLERSRAIGRVKAEKRRLKVKGNTQD
jgi:hypothetical protein